MKFGFRGRRCIADGVPSEEIESRENLTELISTSVEVGVVQLEFSIRGRGRGTIGLLDECEFERVDDINVASLLSTEETAYYSDVRVVGIE